MYYTNKLYGPDLYKDVEVSSDLPPDEHFYSKTQLAIKIQVFASKYGCNNCFEDMNKLSKIGIICFSMAKNNEHYVYTTKTTQTFYKFSFDVIDRSKIRDIRRYDYSIRRPYAHLFFEIPVVANMDAEKTLGLQKYCFKKLINQIDYNHKKAMSWVRKKQLESDFGDEENGG